MLVRRREMERGRVRLGWEYARGRLADARAPGDQSGGCPVEVLLMRLRTMRGPGGIIDVHLRRLPLGQLVARRRERSQRGALSLLEYRAPAAREFLEGPVIHPLPSKREGVIRFGERVEHVMPEQREDLALDDLHRRLNLRLIAWIVRTRRKNRRPVMRREILIRLVQVGVVVARLPHRAFQIVGDDERGHRAHILEHPHVRADPVEQRLGPRRLRVNEVTRAQRADEDLRLADVARPCVDDRHRGAHVVDEEPLTGDMHLPQHRLQRPGLGMIVATELGVLIAARRLGSGILILGPEQLECDPVLFERLMHGRPVGHRPRRRRWGSPSREQPGLERRLVELDRQRPREARGVKAPDVRVHGALRERENHRDLSLAPVLVEQEA